MMAATMRPETAPALKSGNRSRSTPSLTASFHDWTSEWDADVVLGAAPRYTFGESDRAEHYPDPCMPRPKSKQTRDTFLDKHARNKARTPGPGYYRKIRQHEPDPPKEPGKLCTVCDEASPFFSEGRPRDRQVPKIFSRSVRQANLTDLRQEKNNLLLPSSFFTPGPGEYVAYTSFGAPSGPTRKRFLATRNSDMAGKGRSAEKFHRNAER
eukprot:gb/GFBE01075472.1/.p1 GENE.gb/GFBE01075472.1/~~gb/GFBE01075472.1/.p1  ORF type:complete len:211 (+),score=23.03 gb/GFBE01075472.1/:1-633(+)